MNALAHNCPAPRSILRVIEDGAVSVVYQPIVEAATGHLFAYEALVRTSAAEFDGPGALFDAAVAEGCAGALGRVIRDLAIRGCEDHPLFFNVHPAELNDGYVVHVDDPISRHVQPVFVEITESVPLAQIPFCAAVLSELRSRGIAIVVDDLGAGYSNLKYLADLEPSVVKLDRLLITGLAVDTRPFQLVECITTMCHELGCLVVAEGIETDDELHAVRRAGVDLAQGFLLARPAFPLPAIAMPPPKVLDRPTVRDIRRPEARAR